MGPENTKSRPNEVAAIWKERRAEILEGGANSEPRHIPANKAPVHQNAAERAETETNEVFPFRKGRFTGILRVFALYADTRHSGE